MRTRVLVLVVLVLALGAGCATGTAGSEGGLGVLGLSPAPTGSPTAAISSSVPSTASPVPQPSLPTANTHGTGAEACAAFPASAADLLISGARGTGTYTDAAGAECDWTNASYDPQLPGPKLEFYDMTGAPLAHPGKNAQQWMQKLCSPDSKSFTHVQLQPSLGPGACSMLDTQMSAAVAWISPSGRECELWYWSGMDELLTNSTVATVVQIAKLVP